MLSSYKELIEKLKANNPSFKTLFDQYEQADSERLKHELEIRIKEILEKVK